MQSQPKIALITGGSRGIGAATARVLAAQGYYLCINYRGNHDAATELQQELLQITEKVVIKQSDISVGSFFFKSRSPSDEAYAFIVSVQVVIKIIANFLIISLYIL